jgi:hypothetical protein
VGSSDPRRSPSTWAWSGSGRSPCWRGKEGFYTNRTDFIRTSIRTQLATQAAAIERTVARRTLVFGIQHFSRADLEQLRGAGEIVRIRVLGLATIADDFSPELASQTIAEIEVLGAFRATAAVKAALASRIV